MDSAERRAFNDLLHASQEMAFRAQPRDPEQRRKWALAYANAEAILKNGTRTPRVKSVA